MNNEPVFSIKGQLMSNDLPGITLRDYFAAKAMQILCESEMTTGATCQDIAKASYSMADAMLAERDEGQS